MSYATMDHAGWMESELSARRRNNPKLSRTEPEKLSPFQTKVVDIIGMVGGGIYNAPISRNIDWNWGAGVSVLWRGRLDTWDFDRLTKLVFLCHEARIRCEISPVNPQYLRLSFHPRSHDGGIASCHPDLSEAVDEFKKYLPSDHRIRYMSEAQSE